MGKFLKRKQPFRPEVKNRAERRGMSAGICIFRRTNSPVREYTVGHPGLGLLKRRHSWRGRDEDAW
ncbi:MAG: hypothetical protein CSA96_08840 [Bacteroidetes bacterium]|nr:MAG: hypothetical protein CSA96_08840 [Bacteroidota bacterium]